LPTPIPERPWNRATRPGSRRGDTLVRETGCLLLLMTAWTRQGESGAGSAGIAGNTKAACCAFPISRGAPERPQCLYVLVLARTSRNPEDQVLPDAEDYARRCRKAIVTLEIRK